MKLYVTLAVAAYAIYFVDHIVLDTVERPHEIRRPRWWFDFVFITAFIGLAALAANHYT